MIKLNAVYYGDINGNLAVSIKQAAFSSGLKLYLLSVK